MGKVLSRADNLKKVASYFGVPMEELLEDEPAKEVVLIQKYRCTSDR